MTYLYSTNAVDLLEARQTTGTNNVVLGKFLYNDQHLPTAFWDVAGQMTTNTYNARGQLLATTNPRNETTSYTYDTNGYLLAVDGPLPGTNDSTRFTYDDVGRVQTITSPDGYTLAYRYDNLDRLTNVAYPDGTFTAFTYDKLDRVKSRDRMGRETLFAYDALRHLTSVQDPLNRVTRFEYCGCGSMSGLIDPMGRRTTWDYDLQGRLAAKTYVDGSRVTYAYETTTSRLISVCDEKGQYKFYDYYADDNRRRVSYPNALVATPTVTFTYDTNYNRMLTMQDGIGLTTWSYYPPGVPGALQVAAVDGPWDNDTVTFQYDALGRVTNRAINGVAQTWTYDALGRTTNVVNALGSFTYAYDGVTPRVRNVAYPNGQTSHYDYLDHLGDHRLQRITHLKPDASLLSRFTYAYNPSGNITNWLQEQGALAENWAIGYDSADQLLTVAATQAGTNTMTWNYAYDPAGNRLFEETNGVRRRFDYNSLNQLVSSSDASATNTVYEWDSENRLTAVNKGSHRSEFVHDGFGRRVTIIDKDDGITSSQCAYLWVGFAVCEERDRSGALALKQFFMQGESLAGLGTRTNYYYTTDHLRSVREEIGSQQTMITRFRYGPFGQVFSSTEGTVFSLGFGGFWRHKASGLNLTIFRPYDCQAAKWLSRDPIQKFGIQTGHHYAYVENNPLNLVDPLGLFGMSYSSDALPVNENMQKTMDCMANCLGRNIKCTSGRDKHAPGDPHMSGDAADLGLKSNPGLNRSDMETCYKQCFGAKSLGLDEDSGTSNHHYHFQDKPGLGGWTGFHNWP